MHYVLFPEPQKTKRHWAAAGFEPALSNCAPVGLCRLKRSPRNRPRSLYNELRRIVSVGRAARPDAPKASAQNKLVLSVRRSESADAVLIFSFQDC